MKRIVLLCLTLCAFSSAQAAVINSADINGFRTFQDTNTGLIWLDLNNFFNQSSASMISAANAAGFTFATRLDVETLLNSLPLGGGEWPAYQAIMGDAPNREIIWGAYDDGGDANQLGWAFSFDTDGVWSFVDGIIGINDIPNGGGDFADMNVWAFRVGAVVPEPSLIALLGFGLAALGFTRRR